MTVMINFFKFFLFFTLISLPVMAQEDLQEGCSDNYSSLVFNEENGEICYEERSEKFVYPASLTKLMTLYLTFEAIEQKKLSLDQILTISERGEEISNVNKINSLHLKAGDQISVRDAINAAIVKSFNEAAVTLAEAVSDNEWDFVRKMNEKAKKLGMINTSFRNSTGLHEEGQYTTSYDLARLVVAMKRDFPQNSDMFSQKFFHFKDKEYKTTNNLLFSYQGIEGMKTGFTKASGFNLISVAKKDNLRLVSILLSCKSEEKRNAFTVRLLNDSFYNIANKNPVEARVTLQKKFKYK